MIVMKTERTVPSEYTFPEGHLKALAPGEKGTETKENAERELRRRFENFDIRLQQFINDLYFSYETDIMECENAIFDDLASVDKPNDVGDWEVCIVMMIQLGQQNGLGVL